MKSKIQNSLGVFMLGFYFILSLVIKEEYEFTLLQSLIATAFFLLLAGGIIELLVRLIKKLFK
jgi:hypothetical protein